MRVAYSQHNNGVSVGELAEQYGKHRRTVEKWIARGKREEWDKQPISFAERQRMRA